jgi:hypothetical protein
MSPEETRSMRKILVLISAALLALPACVGDSHESSSIHRSSPKEDSPEIGFELAGTLPGPYGFTMYTVGTCYKARRVPTANPVSDLAGWYRGMMPDLGYKMNYERPFFTEGLGEKACGKYLRVRKTWGHRRVEQAWSAAWEEREGIFCPTVWVTVWSTKAGDVYLNFAEAATCPL